MKKIPIIINNRTFEVRANASVLQACETLGFDIPRFCYHEKLSVAGNCRMCLVEIAKSPKPVVSCAMPVSKDMVIFTNSPLVKKARESVLEFLLINHPLDCPICDQGGECDLQDETLHYGSDRGRFAEKKRSVEDKEFGPIIKTIMTRCIHCTRCIRFAAEIAGVEVLGAFNRGPDMEIGTYIQHLIKSELSGNLVDLCPVGALTSKPFAYLGRNWELQKISSIDFFDPVCNDILINTRKVLLKKKTSSDKKGEDIVRILPNANGIFEESWISDRTRYAFDGFMHNKLSFLSLKDRNKDKIFLSAYELKKTLAGFLISNLNNNVDFFKIKSLVVSFGKLNDLETIYTLAFFSKLYGGDLFLFEKKKINMNVDLPSFYTLNNDLNSFEKFKNVVLIGVNTRYEIPLINILLKKFQTKKNYIYNSFFSFTKLHLKHLHNGNSVKAFLDFLWNKKINLKFFNKRINSLFCGYDLFQKENSFFMQNLIRLFGKKLLLKNNSGERLSILHSNIGILNLASLGYSLGVRSYFHNKEKTTFKIDLLCKVQNNDIKKFPWKSTRPYYNVINFNTHKEFFDESNINIPIKNLYEKNFFSFNIENRIRRGYKAITSTLPLLNGGSLETFILALAKMHFDWRTLLNQFWFFSKEIPLKNLVEKVPSSFSFNFFKFTEESWFSTNLLFYPSVLNFYLNDIASKNSLVMAECSLFLKENNNFIRKIEW